jgi:phosphoglycerate dehydrogenase-like enzyme
LCAFLLLWSISPCQCGLTEQVAGAALDVFEKEPPAFAGHPLIGRPDVIVTPHLGASTTEAQEVGGEGRGDQFVPIEVAGKDWLTDRQVT